MFLYNISIRCLKQAKHHSRFHMIKIFRTLTPYSSLDSCWDLFKSASLYRPNEWMCLFVSVISSALYFAESLRLVIPWFCQISDEEAWAVVKHLAVVVVFLDVLLPLRLSYALDDNAFVPSSFKYLVRPCSSHPSRKTCTMWPFFSHAKHLYVVFDAITPISPIP